MSFRTKFPVITFVRKFEIMKLQKEVAEKYRMKTIRPGKYNFPKFGTIDLREITLRQADELVAKGFPFLVKREEPIVITNEQKKDTEIPIKPKPETPDISVAALRKNKTYINKLLSMNWTDLSFPDKVVFDKSEKLFLEKKTLFIENSDMEREMRSLHAKMKALDPDPKNDPKRKKLIERLALLDDQKADNWEKIDKWEAPAEAKEETESEKAVRQALERERQIKANKIYIYRAEKMLPGMKSDTEKQRRRIEAKKKEIERRRQELIEMGAPYE